MSKYSKGATRERELIKIAMASGASLAIRGAGSKSYSLEPDLKVDIVVIKQGRIYLIQSKHQKRRTKREADKFYKAAEVSGVNGRYLFAQPLFIETEDEMKQLMER